MKTFKYRLITAISSGAILLGVMAPSVFAADLEISDNGSNSTNNISVVSVSDCSVNQTSNTTVGVVIGASSNTGGNSANNNTGGNVNLTTGNASTNVTVSVTGGDNSAINPCCCQCNEGCGDPCNSNHSALISGNGTNSTNKITETKVKTSSVKQKSKTSVGALVGAKSKTGKNKTNGNTGSGVDLSTGKAETDVLVEVFGGSNSLVNP